MAEDPDHSELDPLARHACTPAELVRLIKLERTAFLAWRDTDSRLLILPLADDAGTVTVGRDTDCEVILAWDPQVSRHHVELKRIGHVWTVEDAGLSRNGTFVNHECVEGRRRLADHDLIRVGRTGIAFRDPAAITPAETLDAPEAARAYVSPAQRAVLVELCRPTLEAHTGLVSPATNAQIADRLTLSVDTVKQHLRALFVTFGVADLPSSQKRTHLVARAVQQGAVTARQLKDSR